MTMHFFPFLSMIANEPVEQTPGMVEESNYNEPVAPQEKVCNFVILCMK